VIDQDITNDWVSIFHQVNDDPDFRVIQCSWDSLSMINQELTCHLKVCPLRDSGGKSNEEITIEPHFLFIRDDPRPTDSLNELYGFIMANLPSVNSLKAIYMCLERPVVFMELKKLAKKEKKNFPLIYINYYTNPATMALTDKFPGIVKVNSSHNGFGKSKIDDMDHFRDMSTVLTLHSHYATAEAFIDGDFMIRVQKIGPHYRVLKRIIEDKKNWKNDFDEECTSIPLEPQFKFWVDSCSDFYGGMDILSVDAIFKDEQYHIFGLNGSNIKISKKFSEDLLHMAELIVAKIKKSYSINRNRYSSRNN